MLREAKLVKVLVLIPMFKMKMTLNYGFFFCELICYFVLGEHIDNSSFAKLARGLKNGTNQ